ncbi:MAG: FtsX-like permease family protein [Muribaculaceae bacterium]|nr:FtsX-like permease family protein [Muribaculaceae bacterium]
MFRLIFKNLWNRRRAYAWLFIELIVVSALACAILDGGLISIHDANLPLGYDSDRLLIIEAGSIPEGADTFDASAADSVSNVENQLRFVEKVKQMPGVVMVSELEQDGMLNCESTSMNSFYSGTEADSGANGILTTLFIPGTNYFETYGIKSVPGSPSPEELSARSYARKEFVITRSVAELFWPGENAVGKEFINPRDSTVRYPVVGVVEDVRQKSHIRTNCLAFTTWRSGIEPADYFQVLVRLDDTIDPETFATAFSNDDARRLRTGNFYVKSLTPYADLIANVENSAGATAERNMSIALAVFFLINLILGISSSFFLQTRRRIREMGVHLSFGATRRHITAMLMGEGLVMAAIAFIIGDILFLQWALKFGLSTGNFMNGICNPADTWASHFGQHFAILSGIVFILVIICVLIGTWLPARSLSRISPVEALRNE